ncbi:MAG: M6 family metalloprotease domain-containing protein [Planctomycetota bacterium]|jgi:M6 family metalloprotease-like protein
MFNQKCVLKRGRPVRVFFIAIILFFGVCVQAAPHWGDMIEVAQPDGVSVSIKVWGDEFYIRAESLDGYTLTRDPQTGFICYADVDNEGEFISTGIVYTGEALSELRSKNAWAQQRGQGLKKGLKLARTKRIEKANINRALLKVNQPGHVVPTPDYVASDTGAPVSAAAAPLAGDILGLTLLIQFPDETGTISQSEIDNYCNQVGYNGYSNNGSIRDYFYDVSDGSLTYTNYVTTYYTALNNKSYYTDPNISYGTRAGELIAEALDWLDDPNGLNFDFSTLSIDGSNYMLAINAFYVGYSNSAWAEGLWPHQGGMYGDFTSDEGVKSGVYQITNIGSSLSLGTFCHENGHMICDFPDLYDYGHDSRGIGYYGLMASSGSTNPRPPNPYFRDLKGWETIVEISADAPGTIRSHQANSFTTYRYSHPTNEQEFFLIESRLQTGRNSTIPDEGLLIWHVDEAKYGYGANDEEDMTPELHYCVSVEQADGAFHLENDNNGGGSGDLFHAGDNDAFNDTTLPDAKWWDGSDSGLDISDISAVGSSMSFVVFAQESYPPVAIDNEVAVTDLNGVVIELTATDDGLPASPGKLSYIITSLPAHGWLFDPNDGLEIITTPYILQNDANSVIYEPCPYYFSGTDAFTFKANDGGEAPDGGDSNIADVNVVMNMLSDTVYEVHTIYKDYIPFMTGFKKVRSQALYHADELGSKAQVIASLALNIETAPAIEIQNWTIRMKHTTLSEYPTAGVQFDNDGWTVVYDANETITQTGWHDFALEKTFDYDGTSNLMIDFSFDNTATSAGYGYVYDSATGTEYRIISYWSNSGDPLTFQTPNVKWKRLFNVTLKGQPDTEILYSDFNYNCSVGAEDLMTMINTWLAQEGDANYNSDCDISMQVDKKVNLADFAVLASEWLLAIE